MQMDELEIETETEDLHPQGEEKTGEQAHGEEQPGAEETLNPESEDDGNEGEVSIGEPDPQAEEERKAPQWVRELRKANLEKTRRIKELEAKLNAPAEIKPVRLGAKPKIEDFDYDAEKFEVALTRWFEDKNRADAEEQRRNEEARAQDDAWQAKLGNYQKLKTEIKVTDFQEAELETQNALSVVQQGIVVQGCENPALVVYAIGKNPAKAKELAAITDPVKFAFTIAKLETQLKVTPRKPKSEPERVISGTGRTSGAVDSAALDRLREDARKTGDYTKVIAYKQKLAQKG
jgi:hypothetical protein